MKKQEITNVGFSIPARIKSFSFAINGIKLFFKSQHNAWIHAVATVMVISSGYVLDASTTEWCFLLFAIGFVFTAEAFNTAIEYLTDLVSPEYNETAGRVKDVAAGAVLIASVTALIIGCIIFLPKLII